PTLAALRSTRAIETRSLPTSLAATHRGFAFYVAFPKAPFPIATCSMSLSPKLHSLNRDVFYVADPIQLRCVEAMRFQVRRLLPIRPCVSVGAVESVN